MLRDSVEVKSGEAYDALFPRATGKTIVVRKDATVDDTLDLIRKVVEESLEDTRKIAKVLKGKTLEETCANIWHFVFDHIRYKRDDAGKEQVRRPARTWQERATGADCDCMTTFISSILTNLKIPHKYRIAMYDEARGWQHIYPIVGKSRTQGSELKNRESYIVLDCVKYAYDEEEPYKKIKEFDMRLEYLNGPDEEEQMYEVPMSADIQDLSGASDYDEEELGKIGQWLKKTVKKVGDTAGKGIRAVNKVANPATILLRNGFLLAMQANLMNVAARLRYAYLTDAEARAKGINLTELAKVRNIKQKAEVIFWQAGGDKANFKKAILHGKGNQDKAVPANALGGVDDTLEYTLMTEGDLGVAPAAAIAAATATVTAIAGALSQVKGLFSKPAEAARNAPQTPDTYEESEEMYQEQEALPIIQVKQSPIQKVMKAARAMPVTINTGGRPQGQSNTNVSVLAVHPQQAGTFSGTLAWIKANPTKTLVIAAAIGGGTYLLLKKKQAKPQRKRSGLSGITRKKVKKRPQGKRGRIKMIRL